MVPPNLRIFSTPQWKKIADFVVLPEPTRSQPKPA